MEDLQPWHDNEVLIERVDELFAESDRVTFKILEKIAELALQGSSN